MPNLANDEIASGYVLTSLPFGQAQAGASQAAVALKLNVNAATSGSLNITGVPALLAGSIVGITVIMTANKTAGAMSYTPTINGTAITTPASLVAVAMANATKQINVAVDAQQAGARFKAGDLLGVKITTDGSYAPTTNDVFVLLHVMYEAVQF
jgi:hypothetical protein